MTTLTFWQGHSICQIYLSTQLWHEPEAPPNMSLGGDAGPRAATPPAGNDNFPRVPPPKIQHFKAFPSRHVVGIIYHLSGLQGVISRLYICDDFKKVSKTRLLLLCLWLLGGRVQAAASCAIMKGNGSLYWVGAVNIDSAIAGRATLFEESSEVKVICLLKHGLEKKTRLMRFCLNDCMQHGLDILQKFVALEIVLQKAWVCNCPDCEVSCSEELPWTLSTKGVSSDHCEYWSQNGKITAATGTCTDSLNVASTLVSNWLRRQSHLLSLVMAVEIFHAGRQLFCRPSWMDSTKGKPW